MSFAIADPVPEAVQAVTNSEESFDFPAVFVWLNRRNLSIDTALVVRVLRGEQEALLNNLLKIHNLEQFRHRRHAILRQYWELSCAIRSALKAQLTVNDWQGMANESVQKFSKELLESGIARFGQDVTDEILFAVETLGRTARLLGELAERERPVRPSPDCDDLRQLREDYQADALWCEVHFHLAYLWMRSDESICPFLLEETVGGLRSAVRMYGAVSAALRLARASNQAPLVTEVALDDEDRLLADYSARDHQGTDRHLH